MSERNPQQIFKDIENIQKQIDDKNEELEKTGKPYEFPTKRIGESYKV